MSHVILNEWLYPFIARFINIHGNGVLVAFFGCCMAGATWNCWHLSASSVYTIQLCTSLQCHFIQSHIGWVYVCLAATCHLHFWQNDWDLLSAAAETRGWNRYRNKSQHRNLTKEKKILSLLLPGFEPRTFWTCVWHSNHWASPEFHVLTSKRNTLARRKAEDMKVVTCRRDSH